MNVRALLQIVLRRPLLLHLTTLWRLVRSCAHGWLSESSAPLRRHRHLTLMPPPFFTPASDLFCIWDAKRQLPPASPGVVSLVRRGLEWFLDCNVAPLRVFLGSRHCPHRGRPKRPATTLLGPPQKGFLPELFCCASLPLSATCSSAVAARSATAVAGSIIPYASPVTLTAGNKTSFSSRVIPITAPLPPAGSHDALVA